MFMLGERERELCICRRVSERGLGGWASQVKEAKGREESSVRGRSNLIFR